MWLDEHVRLTRQAAGRHGAVTAVFALTVAFVAAPNGAAFAQSLRSAQAQTSDLFARDRAVTVRQRPRPAYDAQGLPLGSFSVFPKAQIDAEYADNIFAVPGDPDHDSLVRFRPTVSAQSNWSTHQLKAYARGSFARNRKFESEDTNDWAVGGSGRLDIVRGASFSGGADYIKATESRTSASGVVATAKPVEFKLAQSFVSAVRTMGRLRVTGRGDFQSFDYKIQNDRDRETSTVMGRVDYAISPATAIFTQVSANKRKYDSGTVASPARTSDGYEALVGVNFEVGAVSRGEVAVGYVSQSFNSSAYGDISGFGARSQLEWFPTELTTATLTASRTIEDAGVVGAAGYLASDFSISVDHELLRNLILNGRLGYAKNDFSGIDRKDTRTSAAIGATYLIDHNKGLNLSLTHLKQDSKGLAGGPNYDANNISVGLILQF